ncbi:NADPH-dependent FMN reductase [Bifidobacterium tibiigranuli]|uniref:NADPH-dependent FMN reductase n=1 Tax=Bifidobacterium tibiigranuli TaxID=2172043 RepID=UPI0026EBC014|nr:NAD(P)H-dependent oxidoreductase [Bifidobacterium tibiigranuli]MCI1650487.1 NAD(P)H-dependent oxidoreductase [Bifidobacterium tibiigranuli]MCI2185319.1 NAD(P)H-dependent oxidoreductase [Bifidobacterium tibiigranuli]MCI2203706.1 NAD(P)H-dependent oxidoreductase [Bifidobacterium tibiigranuli]
MASHDDCAGNSTLLAIYPRKEGALMLHYVGIAGTNIKRSTNLQLLQYMRRRYSKEAVIEIIDISNLPVFYKANEDHIPDTVNTLAAKIEAADGVVIATPEYDHAVPAVLSSALAWLSYHTHPFAGKPVMIVGASYGSLGTSRAQAQLRQILDSPELKASIMPSSEFLVGHSLEAFDENGNLKNSRLDDQLKGLFSDFDVFVKLTKQMIHSQRQAKEQTKNVNWLNN